MKRRTKERRKNVDRRILPSLRIFNSAQFTMVSCGFTVVCMRQLYTLFLFNVDKAFFQLRHCIIIILIKHFVLDYSVCVHVIPKEKEKPKCAQQKYTQKLSWWNKAKHEALVWRVSTATSTISFSLYRSECCWAHGHMQQRSNHVVFIYVIAWNGLSLSHHIQSVYVFVCKET